jgi:hypothetical protein
MEFKGTQGEVKVVTKDNERVIMFGNYNVAKMVCAYNSKEDEANESLLESAPDLLAALQGFLKLTKKIRSPSIDYANVTARNAINKALGL